MGLLLVLLEYFSNLKQNLCIAQYVSGDKITSVREIAGSSIDRSTGCLNYVISLGFHRQMLESYDK
jgi:hypothetical protein